MSKSKELNSPKTCRCCGDLYPPDSDKILNFFNRNYLETKRMLWNIHAEMKAWQISASSDDGLPQYICKECYTKFVDYFNFRANCISVQAQLLHSKKNTTTSEEKVVAIEIKCLGLAPNKPNINDELEKTPTKKRNGINIKQKLRNINTKNDKNSTNEIIEYIKTPDSTNENKKQANDSSEDRLEESINSNKVTVTYKKLKNNFLFCKYCCFDEELLLPSNVIFPSETALLEHIESRHDPLLPYNCPICQNKFKTIKQSRHHILYKHKKTKAICQICGVDCDYTNLNKHMKTHHSASDFKCETCGKKFLNISLAKFEYHQRWHNSRRQKKCQYCGKVFVQGIHLRVHMMTHTKDFNINCEICDKGFRSQYAKGIHMHKAHDAKMPVTCLYCEERFVNYSTRARHMNKAHDYVQNTVNEKLKCLKCNKVYRRETGFRTHLAKGCQGVREIVKRKAVWKSVRNISCQYCAQLFGKESALIRHLELHSEEGRPFKCDICHLNYKTNSHLELHKRIKHSNLKPYVCGICGKGFKVNFNLTSHKKTSHR